MASVESFKDDLTEIESNEPSEIQAFYAGCSVFITGATGFMGQILLEKLLRSCPGINKIYILVRPKKNKQIEERVEELFKSPIFQLLDETTKKKVIAVPGDVSLDELGMSVDNRRILQTEVNVIFHAAATVRFDEKLRTAVDINVKGTQTALALARATTGLKAFIYVSTAYANCPKKNIDETFLSPSKDGETLQTLCRSLTDEQIEALLPSLLGEWPNTYAFTKSSAEDIVRRYGEGLPVAVIRPSIVVSTVDEPIKGWINNLYGASGVTTGASVGILKTLHCNPKIHADIVPVDKAINCCIAMAWKVGIDHRSNTEHVTTAPRPQIYNYVSSVERPITWGEYMKYNEQGLQWPNEQAIWYYFLTLNKNKHINMVYVVLFHFLPALLVDTAARLAGKTPRLWNIYKKVYKFSNVIAYFCTQSWTFTNDNTQALWLRLNTTDRRLFHFNMADVNWQEAMLNSIRGIRIYMLNESFDNLERARSKYRKLKYAHYTLVTIFSLLLLKLLVSIIMSIVNLF